MPLASAFGRQRLGQSLCVRGQSILQSEFSSLKTITNSPFVSYIKQLTDYPKQDQMMTFPSKGQSK